MSERIKLCSKVLVILVNVPIERSHFEIGHEFLFIVQQLELVQEVLHHHEGHEQIARAALLLPDLASRVLTRHFLSQQILSLDILQNICLVGLSEECKL